MTDQEPLGQSGVSPEVIALLNAAEQIADGLADLALAIYDRDPRWKDALAVANQASTYFQDASRAAQEIECEPYVEDDDPCGRIMVGSGTDTYDPTCDLMTGHSGPCKSRSAIDQHRLES